MIETVNQTFTNGFIDGVLLVSPIDPFTIYDVGKIAGESCFCILFLTVIVIIIRWLFRYFSRIED